MDENEQRIAAAITFLAERWREPPSLETAAAHVGLSAFHFQRSFRRLTGVSPKRFVASLSADHAEKMLREARPMLETTFECGLSGPSRLHDLMVSVRAMTPGELRRGGAGLEIAWDIAATPLGACLIATTQRGICELAFLEGGEEPENELALRWPGASRTRSPEQIAKVTALLFDDASDRPGPLSLHVRGTNFQLRVWKALLAIPRGQITSYGELARTLGRPSAARAVGRAVGTNPVGVIIPCHRVLCANGALGGYRWGPLRKRALLALESAHP